ncbi:MAG: hypothetical protein ACE5Q3_18525 [Alphaproteobacteria bacterium]
MAPLAVGIALSFAAAPLGAQDFEAPPVLNAAQTVPAELRQGTAWTLSDEVISDGYVNQYVIDHEDGELVVQSEDLLAIRAHELEALAQLNEISRSQVFADAAVEAAKSPFVFAKDMVTSPVATASGVVKGTGRFVRGIGRGLFGKKGEQEEGVVGATLGTAAAKRAFAEELQIDPYAENELLQARLNDMAWTAFAGGLSVSVASDVALGGTTAGTLITIGSFGGSMNALIYDKTPSELHDLNKGKLDGMDVSQGVTDSFLGHPLYSPTRKTYLVGALEQMEGVSGRGIFVDRAIATGTVPDAFLWQRMAEMMAAYHVNVEPASEVTALGALPLIRTQDNKLIGVLPNDYLAWTEELAAEAEEAGLEAAGAGERGRELWFGGTVSPLAKQKLEEIGWTVLEGKGSELRLP